jgi:hypothetical protein
MLQYLTDQYFIFTTYDEVSQLRAPVIANIFDDRLSLTSLIYTSLGGEF